jgi:mono/diheme cytochrome c family protein
MKKVTTIISLMAVFSCVTIAFTSCESKDKNSPGVEFMPDMYRSPSLESNMAYVHIVNGKETGDTAQSNRMPVAGTIARGFLPYPYANTSEGYELAKVNSHNPLERNDSNLKTGEELYGKFCIHCHGATGQGDGAVGLKLPGAPPAYTDPAKINMTEGELFQIITYGKGLMGPHAPLVSQEERWKLVLYVQHLQHPDGAAPAVDSAAVAKPEVKKPKNKK